MAVPDQVPFNQYSASGATNTFPYTFKILGTDQIVVKLDGVIQVSGFTVSGVGMDAGGDVVFSVNPAATTLVELIRTTPASRSTDYAPNGDLREEVLDADFDRAYMALQEMQEQVDRAMKLPQGSTDSAELGELQADAYLRVNSAGTALEQVNLSLENATVAALRSDLASTTDPAKGSALVGFLQSGTGAVGRTAQAKMRDIVSVKDFGAVGDGVADDTLGIAAAVAYCYSTGEWLYWPDGTYLTTASIANFHSVRHVGPGIVKRDGDLFYVQPKDTNTNRLYVSTTGAAGNDGLSPSQPFATFQSMFSATTNYGPLLNGTWELIAAAGSYDFSGGQQTFSTPSKNRVIIRGPAVGGHPNVPTCLVDGGGVGVAYRHGLSASGGGVKVEFRDIKAQNFTTASGNTRIGIVGENEADVYLNNCHTYACSWTGAYLAMLLRARVAGGIFDGNSVSGACGIITNDTEATIGYQASSTSEAPIVKNCTAQGIYWSRGSQGHIDYTTVQDCGIGILMEQGSSAALPGCDLKRNTVGLRTLCGAFYREDGVPVVYNHGTADANTTPFEYYAHSGNGDETRAAQSYQRVAYDRTTRTASGITSGSFPTLHTLPAHRLSGVGKSCRVHVKGVYTVVAGDSLKVSFGGMTVTFTVPAGGTSVAFEIDLELMEVAGGYRAIGRIAQGLSAHRFAQASAGFDSAVANAVSIGYNLTDAGDALSIYRADIYVMG